MRALGRIRPIGAVGLRACELLVRAFRRAGMVILAGTDSNNNHAAPYQTPQRTRNWSDWLKQA